MGLKSQLIFTIEPFTSVIPCADIFVAAPSTDTFPSALIESETPPMVNDAPADSVRFAPAANSMLVGLWSFIPVEVSVTLF